MSDVFVGDNDHGDHIPAHKAVVRHGMTQERWDYLMQPFEGDESVMLTAEELASGWHWCDEWDGLLIHSDDREFEHCKCDFMKKFRTPERIEKMKQQQALDSMADIDNALGFFGPDDIHGMDWMTEEANKNNEDFRKSDME